MEKSDVQNANTNSLLNKKCPYCGSNNGFRSGIILDPFSGSGTTCLVAKKLGRNYIGIDLNPDYCKIAEARLKTIQNKLF
jgi:methylase of polypeptide subunit release factors